MFLFLHKSIEPFHSTCTDKTQSSRIVFYSVPVKDSSNETPGIVDPPNNEDPIQSF